ncbi:glycosyltransferase family 39 protein [Candidatus Daviesbacteria bacterium]|nr:glycosyltransferase family 39 protein [Candidatus Daviesbacteria bacterium]
MTYLKKIVKSTKIQILFLILITILIYANTLQNGFAWDDYDFLYIWPSIKDNGGLSVTFSLPSLMAGDLPSNHLGVYRPLRSVFYVLSFKIYGTNPFGYHLQAIFIHLSAVLLIYFITRLIINKPLVPFMTALLFATHPIHTESVSFITASFDTVGVVFLLLSFYLYLKKTKAHLFASYIYAAFAFFTYEMTLVLPLLIILYDFCFKKRLRIKVYLPYFILLMAYGIIRFLLLKVGNRADYLGPNFLNSALLSRIETPELLLGYFSWLVLPINLTITHNVPEKLLSGLLAINNFSNQGIFIANLLMKISIIVPIITIASVVYLILKIFSKRKEIAFSLCWILISLITVSNILPQGAPWTERYLYLPSYGFVLLIAYSYNIFSKKISLYLLIVLFFANIIFYSTVTFLRNKDWQNDKTLFSSVLKINPNNDSAYNGIGLFYLRAHQPNLAVAALKKALKINPNNIDSKNRLDILSKQGIN